MKFNIKPTDARYIIDKKNRVVVCIIENTSKLFTNFVQENLIISSWCDDCWTLKHSSGIYGSRLENQLKMPNKFIGVARCSEEDEWNEKLGKLIAFSRAKDNLNKSFIKRANTYINYIDKAANNAFNILTKIADKLTINTEHRHNLIDSLVGEN